MDDSLIDNCWFYCPHCDEEYNLPEIIEKCPICDSKDITTGINNES